MEKLGKRLKAHEEDLNVEFEELTGQEESSIQDFFENNKNFILGGLGVVILLVAAYVFWTSMQKTKNGEASEASFHAVLAWEAGSYGAALNGGDSLGNYLSLLDIIDTYGGTGEGNAAKYYAGVAYLNLGDVDNGISYLEDFSKSDNALSFAAYTALGFAHEEKANFKAAASAFESAATIFDTDKNTAPASLMHAARNYEDAGDKSKALSIYKRIKNDFPSSPEAQNIDKYIGRTM